MTVNEFNSKINLPGLCSHFGFKDVSFVKLPKFGWFCFNKDRSIIRNAVTITDWEPSMAYRYLVRDHPEFQESKMVYSEHSENKLAGDYRRIGFLKGFYQLCLDEMENGKVTAPFGKVRIKKFMENEGLPMFIQNKIGICTQKVLDNERVFGMDAHLDRFILPSWATPFHPCSYESVNPLKLDDRKEIYTHGEEGWYGVLDNRICADYKEFGANLGNTWEKKVDFWQQKVVDLSPNLTEGQCLKMRVEAKNARFTENPINVIIQNNKLDDIKHFLKDLNLVQIRELEKLTDRDLFSHWKQSKQEEITIGSLKFLQKDFRYYYVMTDGKEIEYSNFTVTIQKIKKIEDTYIYCCLIHYNNEEVACEIPQSAFRSYYTLKNWLYKFFLDSALGIPIITPTNQNYFLYVVQKFSENALVDNTIPVS